MITVSSGFVTVIASHEFLGCRLEAEFVDGVVGDDLHPAMSRYDCTLDRAKLSPTLDSSDVGALLRHHVAACAGGVDRGLQQGPAVAGAEPRIVIKRMASQCLRSPRR